MKNLDGANRYKRMIGAFCLLIGCFLIPVSSPAMEVPAASFLSAALRNQELEAGASLQVDYVTTAPGESKAGVGRAIRHYIRTAKAQRLDEKWEDYGQFGIWEHSFGMQYSYDRLRREYRRLSVRQNRRPNGLLVPGDGPSGVFAARELLETALFPLWTYYLVDVVSLGQVSSSTEEIDGYACWKVSIRGGSIDGTLTDIQVHVWLDPDAGFCPRKIVIMSETSANRTTVHLRQYQAVSSGVWFPTRGEVWTHEDQANPRVVSEVKNVSVGATLADQEVLVEFPAGTTVVIPPHTVIKWP